jgi:hypothetical protein
MAGQNPPDPPNGSPVPWANWPASLSSISSTAMRPASTACTTAPCATCSTCAPKFRIYQTNLIPQTDTWLRNRLPPPNHRLSIATPLFPRRPHNIEQPPMPNRQPRNPYPEARTLFAVARARRSPPGGLTPPPRHRAAHCCAAVFATTLEAYEYARYNPGRHPI